MEDSFQFYINGVINNIYSKSGIDLSLLNAIDIYIVLGNSLLVSFVRFIGGYYIKYFK
jgi:hypothetical protein